MKLAPSLHKHQAPAHMLQPLSSGKPACDWQCECFDVILCSAWSNSGVAS